MSGVIPLIVPARGGPFHGGGCINATRWSAILRENVVTVPANLPDTKGRSPVLMVGRGGSGGGGGGEGEVYLQTHGVRKVARETGAVIPNQIAAK